MKTIVKYILSKTLLNSLIVFIHFLSLTTYGQEYAIGADLSFLKSAEDKGFGFKENNEVKPGLKIFRDHGYNWIRLRVFHGVFAGCDTLNRPEIMIHIDQGGNKERTKYFFDKFISYGIDFNYIGQSYYPWWHGNLLDLRENMIFMAETYRKPVILVEVAYCSSPTEYRKKPAPFPESPEGQKEFLDEVNRIVLETPGNLGKGIFWWEPSTYGGRSARDFFDEDGNVLPVISVFDKYTRH